jgi:hypothetical protein
LRSHAIDKPCNSSTLQYLKFLPFCCSDDAFQIVAKALHKKGGCWAHGAMGPVLGNRIPREDLTLSFMKTNANRSLVLFGRIELRREFAFGCGWIYVASRSGKPGE